MSHLLQKEISTLQDLIIRICADVEKSLSLAISSLVERDAERARQVITLDDEIDQMEVETEEHCLKVLALHQPVAFDLRFIVAILKINNDLERIGDLAVNIAQRALFLADRAPYPAEFDFSSMATITAEMLRKSVDALVRMDAGIAREVLQKDDEVDRINSDIFKMVESRIKAGDDNVAELINLLSVSRHLERIADHATNIAEDVIYIAKGTIVRHSEEAHRKA